MMKSGATVLSGSAFPIADRPRFPLLALLHPREQSRSILVMLAIGLLLGAISMAYYNFARWQATTLVITLLLIPGIRKWRADYRRYGSVVMVLSIIISLQGFHMIEHLTQWVQNHVLLWTTRASTGLLSAANSEWVHFVWNWGVLLVVIYLVHGGVRSGWAWLLLGWSVAHTLEHTYMFVRFLEVQNILAGFGLPSVTAQGLPGIVGRDGWLARSELTRNTFVCTLPGITTATRLDVHFWWNAVETVLLLSAASVYLRRRMAPEASDHAAAGPSAAQRSSEPAFDPR